MADTPTDASDSPVPSVAVGDILPRLDRGEGVLLLDVRNEEEYETWKVEARRPVETVHVPYFDFIEDAEAALARVPRGREVVVLCAQGGSSEMVAGMLQEAGVPAANVEGGMIAYGVYLEPVSVPLAAAEAARFELWQVNRRGKACLSYVLVSGGEAVLDIKLEPAKKETAISMAEALDARGRAILYGIHFDSNSAVPRPESAATLQQILALLRSRPVLGLVVEGHTDSQNTEEFNQKLSENRAKAVVEWLVKKGIAADRLRPVGYGESRPVADNRTAEGRQKNRRVEVEIIGSRK